MCPRKVRRTLRLCRWRHAPPVIPPEQATVLGWIVGPGLFGLWLVTLLFLSRYRLTREEHARILGELARRHEHAPA